MVKAFWLSLVNPGDTKEIINEEIKGATQKSGSGSALSKYSIFGKKKPNKGRSLKN